MVGAEEIVGAEGMDVTQGEQVEKKEETKHDEKKDKPDFIYLFLNNIIDSVLFQEVTTMGLKMNAYRSILAKAIMEFSGDHQDEEVDLTRLGDAFRAGWKVYREKEDEEATVDVFMKAMNNQLWIPKSSVTAE